MTNKPLTIFLLLIGCMLTIGTSTVENKAPHNWERPTVKYPEDNPFSEKSIELGGLLFFEVLLSKDTSISCQSCHLITEAFADHLPVGEGILGRTVTRNTPSLINTGLHPYFMADGKFNSLEEQVLGPINEHREFDMSPEKVITRLKNKTIYNELSNAAYNKDIDIEIVKKALANFERVILSQDTRFDQFMKGEIELTQEEQIGWELFKSPNLNVIASFNFIVNKKKQNFFRAT